MMSFLARIKPNIVFAILAITVLGLLISLMGFHMGQETGSVTGAGVAASSPSQPGTQNLG